MRESNIRFKNDEGLELAGIVALPDDVAPSGFVVLLHGFVHHKNSTTNKVLSERLTELGIGTLRFDSHGHGESYGDLKELETTKGIRDVKAALDCVRKDFLISKVGLFGSSFGGWMALAAAEKYPGEITCLALKEPVSDFKTIWDQELGEHLPKWKEEGIYKYRDWKNNVFEIGYGFYEDILNFDLYSGLKSLTMPVMIVHGAEDRLVPASQSEKLAGLLGGRGVLKLIEGADHGFIGVKQFSEMTRTFISWLSGYLR